MICRGPGQSEYVTDEIGEPKRRELRETMQQHDTWVIRILETGFQHMHRKPVDRADYS